MRLFSADAGADISCVNLRQKANSLPFIGEREILNVY